MFNNPLFSSSTISAMHPSMERLYQATKNTPESQALGQSEVARLLNQSPQTINNWEERGVSSRGSVLAQAAFGVNAFWLLNGVGPKAASQSNVESASQLHPARNYPVISCVQAGEWTDIYDQFQPGDADEWLPSTLDLGKCGYMLRVTGKSMLDPYGKYSFPPGCILHVHPEADAVVNQFVIVRRNGENTATFKRLVELDGVRYLEAINPDWPERYLKLQEGDVFCGVVRTATLPSLP